MLEIHELLDRYELLYPNDTNISNLRRAYIDKDLNSIFRVTNANEELRKAVVEKNLHSLFRVIGDVTVKGEADDLRKAILENNLHSIFRLVDNVELRKAVIGENLYSIFRFIYDEDVRKLVLEDNIWKLFDIFDRFVQTDFTQAFKRILADSIEIDNDCFSRGQLKSKIWLVDELQKINRSLGTVFLCAGWYGTLATMLFESNLHISKIRSFDIDPSCADIAEVFNKSWLVQDWKFKAKKKNIFDIDYKNYNYQTINKEGQLSNMSDSPTTVINTSCEHIPNFSDWYEKLQSGTLVVLQTNNYFDIEEHINCKSSLKEFSDETPMKQVLFEGVLDLEKYKRFMKIGIR